MKEEIHQEEGFNSQREGLSPLGVQRGADGFGFLFALVLGVRNKLQLHIGIGETIGVHWDEVPGLAN